jgi:hypothetical protein
MAHPRDPSSDAPVTAPGTVSHQPAQEISLRAVGSGAALVTVLLLIGLLVPAWVVSTPSPRERAAAAGPADDLASPPLRPANAPLAAPPVEADSTATLRETRADEHARLSTYRWIDRAQGVVAVPIERAIELVLEEGLPVAPPPKEGR